MKAIILTKGKIATVDDADFDHVNQFKWHAHGKKGEAYYGRRNVVVNGKKTFELMHQFLYGKERVDHKNGDGTDNRRENIRPATQAQNNRAFKTKTPGTSSRFRGVYFNKPKQVWQAYITYNYKHIYVGAFDDEGDAARAYDAKACELFGEFAAPNFPT